VQLGRGDRQAGALAGIVLVGIAIHQRHRRCEETTMYESMSIWR
jgi:hypothetical protein